MLTCSKQYKFALGFLKTRIFRSRQRWSPWGWKSIYRFCFSPESIAAFSAPNSSGIAYLVLTPIPTIFPRAVFETFLKKLFQNFFKNFFWKTFWPLARARARHHPDFTPSILPPCSPYIVPTSLGQGQWNRLKTTILYVKSTILMNTKCCISINSPIIM